MAQWQFTSNRQGWGADDSAWTDEQGRPAGCLVGSQDIGGLSISVTPDSPCSFWARVVWDSEDELLTPEDVDVGLTSNSGLVDISGGRTISGLPYDSGWFKVFGNAADTGTVTDLGLTISTSSPDWPGIVYFDSVYVAETEPADSSGLRYLGLVADSGRLYISGIENGTLTAWQYSLNGLGELDSDTFGAADFGDPDTFTRGLLPVARPGADGVVYVFGRDGSNRQVLRNDLNGSAGWVDVGAGTATWGTAKYCVALMPDQGRPDDVVAAFSDNDVYRTETGTASWSKQGDAASNLRTGARHPTAPEGIWLAGTAAGTLLYSGNMGASFSSVGGTAVTGTINAVEVSR